MQGDGAATLVNRLHRYDSVAATTIASGGGTTVGTFDVSALENCYFDITVVTAALTAFNVLYRANENGLYKGVAVDAGDYTTPTAPVIRASGALTTAAAGNHNLLMDVRGIESIRITATSGGTATVALEVGAD